MGRKGVFTCEHLLTDDEINKIRKVKLTDDEKLIFYGLSFTGMRVGEFLHLNKDWINWKDESIKIPREMSCTCTECMTEKPPKKPNKKGIIPPNKPLGLWTPKTKNGIREIPLLPNTFTELNEILKDYFASHNSIHDTIHNRGMAWFLLESVRKKAKLTGKLFPHCLRGTYAKHLAKAGLDEFYITQIMGWGNIAIAIKYIRMETKDIKKEMIAKVKGW